MGRVIVLIAVVGTSSVLLYDAATKANDDARLPPEFQRWMEEGKARATADVNGPLGREARQVCNRIHGVTVPVQTGKDVLKYYDLRKAEAWTHCVVNYMNARD
jgi:hypothetical protein